MCVDSEDRELPQHTCNQHERVSSIISRLINEYNVSWIMKNVTNKSVPGGHSETGGRALPCVGLEIKRGLQHVEIVMELLTKVNSTYIMWTY